MLVIRAPFRESFNPLAISSTKKGIAKLKTIVCLPPIGLKDESLAPWILWNIWLSRNNKIFKGSCLNEWGTLSLAITRAREWIQAQEEISTPIQRPIRPSSADILENFIRCQTDGSWSKEHRAGGTGWTFHNQALETLNQGSKAFKNIASPLIAEGLALRQALDLGFARLHVASDSQQLIAAINSDSIPSEIFGIVQDIAHISLSFSSIIFGSIPRAANSLAKRSLQNFLSGE
ncbi:unnamed protein product [Microthlaspi erraticum]|uniref:RNase H type-1 domain-containing protein n=1 Tax=Microthlaspi erraticum TaxID=1685480 RepID=A0A6D2KJM7_9BRAS|nr:unnamed protein product [Microthlaspi erraticum]